MSRRIRIRVRDDGLQTYLRIRINFDCGQAKVLLIQAAIIAKDDVLTAVPIDDIHTRVTQSATVSEIGFYGVVARATVDAHVGRSSKARHWTRGINIIVA